MQHNTLGLNTSFGKLCNKKGPQACNNKDK
jgi:hypothetical protein